MTRIWSSRADVGVFRASAPRRSASGRHGRARSAGVPLVAASLAALLAAGCAPTFRSHGPYSVESQTAPRRGLRYQLGKESIVVDGSLVETRSRTLERRRGAEVDFVVVESARHTATDVVVAVEVGADPSAFYVLDLGSPGGSRDSLGVELRPNGLLKSVNARSVGLGSEVLKSVAHLTGALAAAALPRLAGSAESAPAIVEAAHICELHALEGLACYYVQEEPRALKLLEERRVLRELLAEREAGLERLDDRIVSADEEKDGKALRLQRTLMLEAVESVRESIETASAAFEAGVAAFGRSLGLGQTQTKLPLHERYELEELPPPDVLLAGDRVPALLRELNARGFGRAAALLERSGVLLTLSEVPAISALAPSAGEGCDAEPGGARAHGLRVHYRQSYPRELGLHMRASLRQGASQSADDDQLELVERRSLNLMHAGAPVLCVELEGGFFGERALGLVFDEKGSLARLERSATASAPDLLAGIAQASTALRDELEAGLASGVKIDKARAELAAGPLDREIERLKARKELLDRRLALEGATASYDLVLEKQGLDARLGLLEAEQQLELAGVAPDLRLETAGLKAELERLKVEFDILSRKLALKKLSEELP